MDGRKEGRTEEGKGMEGRKELVKSSQRESVSDLTL